MRAVIGSIFTRRFWRSVSSSESNTSMASTSAICLCSIRSMVWSETSSARAIFSPTMLRRIRSSVEAGPSLSVRAGFPRRGGGRLRGRSPVNAARLGLRTPDDEAALTCRPLRTRRKARSATVARGDLGTPTALDQGMHGDQASSIEKLLRWCLEYSSAGTRFLILVILYQN